MTAIKKANELANKMYRGDVFEKTKEEHLNEIKEAKKYALIAVDEALNFTINNCCEHQNRKFWEEVKQEIEKL